MTNSGFNTGLIKAEISNLSNAKKEQGSNLIILENSISLLRRNKSEILSGYNALLSQLREQNIPDSYKRNLEDRVAEIKHRLMEIEFQISSNEKKIFEIKQNKQEIINVISSRKMLLSNIAGRMMQTNISQSSIQTNKEMGRIKG